MAEALTIARGQAIQIQGLGIDMDINFSEFPWHDSTLMEVVVSRRAPGRADRVKMIVLTIAKEEYQFTFDQCYGFQCAMNFGIVAPETIREASCGADFDELRELRKVWARVGVQLEGVEQYELTTNSTNSVLRVFARSCAVCRVR